MHRSRQGADRIGHRHRSGAEFHGLGQAEVENFHAVVTRNENVFRLQVAVHDPLVVRSRQPVCDLDRVLDRLACRERGLADSRPQRLPVEQLHNGIRHRSLVAEIEDAENVGMRQLSDAPGFAVEPRQGRLIVGE